MACLSTSGRQGLFVAVGSRRYHNQRFVCQLMLQQQHENKHRKNLGGSMANNATTTTRNKCSTAATTASRLLSCTATSASLSNAPLHFQQPKRYFHGFNKNTTTTTATTKATSVFDLMVSFMIFSFLLE